MTEEFAALVASKLAATPGLPDHIYAKIGDGSIIAWLLAHQDQIAQLIALILAFIPKTPAV